MKQRTISVKNVALFVAAFCAGGIAIASANLLQNGSFETESTLAPNAAQNWKMNDPDEHGDVWGNATRENWRAHEGQFEATIRGTWANEGDFGGLWQEAAATPGTTYRVTAQFWADANWTASVQELKIEFWSEDRATMMGAVTNALVGIGETWAEMTVDGTAPEGAAWARAVINVSGAGEAGALQIDEVDLDVAL